MLQGHPDVPRQTSATSTARAEPPVQEQAGRQGHFGTEEEHSGSRI